MRTLAFLTTSYFDDVARSKPAYDSTSIELVAEQDGHLVGVMDIAVRASLATIETVAVSPDAGRHGVASALLAHAIERLPSPITAIDAWTREDLPANGWYRKNGFDETFRYLHVFASSPDEMARAVPDAHRDLTPISGFFHAKIEREEELRGKFSRVHICRRYVRSVATGP